MCTGKRSKFLIILVIQWIFLLSDSARARDDLVPGSRYTSARGAGMGDAALSVGEDVASGLYYNPANLGKLRLKEFSLTNFSMGFNSDFLTNLSFGSVNLPFLDSFKSTLSSVSPKLLDGGASYQINFGMPGFACGVLVQTQLGGKVNSDGSVSYRSLYQLIPTLGTGVRLLKGLIRLGYSLQWVNEAVGNVTTTADSVSYTSGIAQGSAISHNLGLGLTAPIKMLPTLDLVVRNVGSASYISPVLYTMVSQPTSVPATEPMTFDAALSVQPHLGQGSILNLVGEIRDASNTSQEELQGRLAVGGELAIRGRFFFRGGWSGGYPAAGFGVRGGKTELSFAWYTSEIGSGYRNDGDSRFMMHYVMRGF